MSDGPVRGYQFWRGWYRRLWEPVDMKITPGDFEHAWDELGAAIPIAPHFWRIWVFTRLPMRLWLALPRRWQVKIANWAYAA